VAEVKRNEPESRRATLILQRFCWWHGDARPTT